MIGCMKFTIAYKRYLCTLNYFQEKDETKSLNFINYEKVQFESSIHDEQKGIFHCHLQTSMMWPSQNFLLYIRNIIKMKVTEWINN